MYPDNFLTLPPELQLNIAQNLTACDLMNLTATCEELHANPFLKKLLQKKINEESFISVGESQLFWCCAGRLFACGYNEDGRLGLGDTVNRATLTPVPLPFLPSEGIKTIIHGFFHVFILTQTKRLFVSGLNAGVLRLSESINRAIFNEVILPLIPEDFIKHVATDSNSFFLTRLGRVFVCGDNEHGALGLGPTVEYTDSPTELHFPLGAGDKICHININHDNSVFLSQQGEVFVCGQNDWGNLGVGDKEPRFVPTRLSMVLAPGDSVQKVVQCFSKLFLITRQGYVFACGSNNANDLGTGTDIKTLLLPTQLYFLQVLDSEDRVADVITIISSTFFITRKGRVFACGVNTSNQLGCPPDAAPPEHHRRIRGRITRQPTLIHFPQDEKIKQVVISKYTHTFFISTTEKLFIAGNYEAHNPALHLKSDPSLKPYSVEPDLLTPLIAQGEGIKQLLTQNNNLFILTQKNELWVCGKNQSGQLGTEAITGVPAPTQVPLPYPLAS